MSVFLLYKHNIQTVEAANIGDRTVYHPAGFANKKKCIFTWVFITAILCDCFLLFQKLCFVFRFFLFIVNLDKSERIFCVIVALWAKSTACAPKAMSLQWSFTNKVIYVHIWNENDDIMTTYYKRSCAIVCFWVFYHIYTFLYYIFIQIYKNSNAKESNAVIAYLWKWKYVFVWLCEKWVSRRHICLVCAKYYTIKVYMEKNAILYKQNIN